MLDAATSKTASRSDFNIRDVGFESAPQNGVTFNGSIVEICESLCTRIDIGDIEIILVTYFVVGPFGSRIPKTAIFNLSKTRHGPVISSSITDEPVVRNGKVCFDLLADYAA